MNGWVLYALCLICALGLELVLTISTIEVRDGILFVLNEVFAEGSVYATELFANAIFRSFLGIATSLVIIIPAFILTNNILLCREYLRIRAVPSVILFSVFLYLNAESENSEKLLYATLSFASLVVMLFREHFMFYTQEWFARTRKDIFVSSILAIIIFILLHPLVFTPGRVMGTLLMVNLWLYTVSERNLWMGVSVHAAWNFVLPESPGFHYLLFIFSCFLAFSRPKYPAYLAEVWHKLPDTLKQYTHATWWICRWPARFFDATKVALTKKIC